MLRRDADSIRKFHDADGAFGNGIAITPEGSHILLAVHDNWIAAIDAASKAIRYLEVPRGPHLMGIDGLYVHRGALVGVQNGTETPRVVRAPLTPDLLGVSRVDVLEQAHPLFAVRPPA